MTRPAAAARARPCIACQITAISCRALARHRTHPCCRHCNHEPQDDQEDQS